MNYSIQGNIDFYKELLDTFCVLLKILKQQKNKK